MKFVYAFLATFLLLGISCTLKSQELIVKGVIISVLDRAPMSDVSISVKGQNTSTKSNSNGKYEITVDVATYADVFYARAKEGPTLIFSFPGYRTLEIPVKGRNLIDMVMQPDEPQLEEIIVTGTAVGQVRSLMSYAVGKVDETSFEPSYSNNFGIGLQGKVPGLRVNQVGGQPGQNIYFQIRSANSIANGQQPLIILDGTYLTNSSILDINPEDIEKIEVLKGSAGASLYGSQAANGVIQVFTKRGNKVEEDFTEVVYRGEWGTSQRIKEYDLNGFTNREILNSSGPQPVLGNPTASNIHNTPLPNLQNYQEDILFKSGQLWSNSISVRKNSKKTGFYTSFQRFTDEGIIQGSDGFTRNSIRLNLDHQISNKFDLQISSMYSNSEIDWVDTYSNGPNSFLATTLFMTPIFDLNAANEEDGSPHDWDIDNTGSSITNPLYDQANLTQTVNRDRLIGSLRINYYINKWLTFNYLTAIDRSANQYELFLNKGYLSTNVPRLFGPLATSNIGGTNSSNGGGIHNSNLQLNSFISRASLNATKKIGDFNTRFRTSFLYESFDTGYEEGRGENLSVQNITSLDNAQSNFSIASQTSDVIANSGFIIGDIDYQNKYLFSGLFRVEGSSLFGREERWSNYYRISGGYRLTEDVKIKGFQDLKFRASIGTAGVRPTFEQRFETFDLVDGTATKNTLGNNSLRPSQSTEVEIGIDATFGKAFDLEFNYAQITTTDQILLAPLTAASGFRGQWLNAGTIDAKVFEGSLHVDLAKLFKFDNKGINWDVVTTFNKVNQEITKLDIPSYTTGPGLEQSNLFLIEEGNSLGTMVGEVFATNLDQLSNQDGINPSDYSINDAGYVVLSSSLGTPEELPVKLLDENGNPLIQNIGDINPDFRIGIAHTFEYKGFQLYGLFDWRKGGDIYNLTKQWLYRDQRHADFAQYDNIAASFYSENGLFNNLVANNHFVEDGSFFMLREASVSYTFQQGALQGIFGRLVEKLTISFIGRNIFTNTDYSGFHPDITSPPSNGNRLTNRIPGEIGSDIRTPDGDPALFYVDAFNYPLSKSYSFSLQVTF